MSLGGQPGSPQYLERRGTGEVTTQDSGFRTTEGGKLLGCAWGVVGGPLLVDGLDWEVGEAALPESTVKMPSVLS